MVIGGLLRAGGGEALCQVSVAAAAAESECPDGLGMVRNVRARKRTDGGAGGVGGGGGGGRM